MRNQWRLTILLEGRETISESSRHYLGRTEARRAMDFAVKRHGDALLSVRLYKPDGALFMNWNRTIEHDFEGSTVEQAPSPQPRNPPDNHSPASRQRSAGAVGAYHGGSFKPRGSY